MESGEKELRKAFEDVTTSNVKAVLEYCKETRKLMDILENKVIILNSTIKSQNDIIDMLKTQLAGVQVKVFSGGT